MRMPGRRGQEPRPQFKLAMRGYDQREVDVYLARLPEDPGLPVPAFARVLRGYDPEQVDLYIEELKAPRPQP